ncbi:MAG: [protein-PII] uridylyltransferase, partial [Pseudomonadota bacterium]
MAPALEIFDDDAVWAAIEAQEFDDAAGLRKVAVAILAEAQKTGRDLIKQTFEAEPRRSAPLVRSYAYLTDGLVRTAWRVATERLHPAPVPTASERLAVVAQGGYGRAEMSPHSDVDLLFVTPYKMTPWAESVIESMLYMLWDLRLTVGHASRTVRDCIRQARDDYTVRTALLELRPIAGDQDLPQKLNSRLWDDLFVGTSRDFVEAKLKERGERHAKQGGQRYVLEPNVKEGKGGLRDLQSLFWIAKYVHRVDKAEDLVGVGVFTSEEYWAFEAAQHFLWAVRAHLHLLSGREADLLTFDLQIEVAARMGYEDSGGRRAVEHFMQDYFRHATHVGELTRIFLTSLEARHVKQAPAILGFLRGRNRRKK